jgi:acetyl esterase
MILLISLLLLFFSVWNSSYVTKYLLDTQIFGYDPISLYLAKTTLLTTPQPFPKNESGKINLARRIMDGSMYGLEQWLLFAYPDLTHIRFHDMQIPVDNGKYLMDIRIYNYDLNQKKKVLMWFHGGGWILGSFKGNHAVCLQYAKEMDAVVVAANYRLAPESVFPTAVNDVYDTLQWTIANIKKFGGDPENIVLSGESAGGNLATAATAKFLSEYLKNNQTSCSIDDKDCQLSLNFSPIKGLILIASVLNATITSPEALQFARANGFLTLESMEWMKRLYQGSNDTNEALRSSYLFSPLNTPNDVLSVFPPTVMITAKHDILTHECWLFTEKLKNLHVPMKYYVYTTTIHAFFSAHPLLGPRALKKSVELLKELSN